MYTTLARTIVLYSITIILFLFRHVTYAYHPPHQQLLIHRHLTQAYSLQNYRHVPQRFRPEHSVAHARAARGNRVSNGLVMYLKEPMVAGQKRSLLPWKAGKTLIGYSKNVSGVTILDFQPHSPSRISPDHPKLNRKEVRRGGKERTAQEETSPTKPEQSSLK